MILPSCGKLLFSPNMGLGGSTQTVLLLSSGFGTGRARAMW